MTDRKIVWKINIGMTISYIISLGIFIFLFIFFSSMFFMIAGLVWITLPVASVVQTTVLSKKVRISFEMGEGEKYRDEETAIHICVHNPVWCMSLFSRMTLGIENHFGNDKTNWEIMMPVRPHRMNEMMLRVRIKDLGTYHFTGEDFQMRDLFGIIRYHIPIQADGRFHCFPDNKKEPERDINIYLNGLTEIDESNRKGHDFAEVSDIREYQPGDRLRDIHWKLSAKQQELMVKERISMAGCEMVIAVVFSDSYELTQKIIEAADSLGKAFLKQRIPVRLLLWNNIKHCFEEFHIIDFSEWLNALCSIYRNSFTDYQAADMDKKISSIYNRLEKYLYVSFEGDEVIVELHENG